MKDILFKAFNYFFSLFERPNINVQGVTGSKVDIDAKTYINSTIVSKAELEISDEWFNRLLTISYDREIQSKYIPDLHQTGRLETDRLHDILEFESLKALYLNQVKVCEDNIAKFKKEYSDFSNSIKSESIRITNASYAPWVEFNKLMHQTSDIYRQLNAFKKIFNLPGYYSLSKKEELIEINLTIKESFIYNSKTWINFTDKELKDNKILLFLFRTFNLVTSNINNLNILLDNFRNLTSYKIIAGNAGTGKTHTSAHIINKVQENGDYVIFFKPKQFNGDNVNLTDRILQILQTPSGYTLQETLDKINIYVKNKNKRCFIIIDALNETTRSSIGFSNIWRDYLQQFINQVCLFSNLYFICTLRTSYIDKVWPERPKHLATTQGFDRTKDIKSACRIYFDYYKIRITNIDTADLSIFRVPLLLDLYCKLVNEDRAAVKEITLNMDSYLQIFADYIKNLTQEVQNKLDLQKQRLITAGFQSSSDAFFSANEASITVDEFNDAFDKEDSTPSSSSIARAVLEGYLVFIRDYVNRNDEIVKHTQQEIGGYLIAKRLIETFPNNEDLLSDVNFREKVLGIDPDKHHQLRLDILKFLIALKPELILRLDTLDSLQISWWYLFNGTTSKISNEISEFLLSKSTSSGLASHFLPSSSNQWFNYNHQHNFNFVARLLENMDLWSFDINWTYFLYEEADTIFELVQENIETLRTENPLDKEYHKLFAKFCAFVTATTIHDLRDLATVYLIEFGKLFPLELLYLTEYTSKLADTQIYERLSSCCYGVAMILQNDTDFVINHLAVYADTLYRMQFPDDSTNPVFNYIVIDSIKHLNDLAIYKKVTRLNKVEILSLQNYVFALPKKWNTPTTKEENVIYQSSRMSWPEPIGMDFAIYTIPRLIDDDIVDTREAVANVFGRVFELGYITSENIDLSDSSFRDFYWGANSFAIAGKADRLGKKYSWRGFFDYAGELLHQKQLDVFEKYSGRKYYQRLSDVSVDVSLPNDQYKKIFRIYINDLIDQNNSSWYEKPLIDTLEPLFKHKFDSFEYVMLQGKVDQRIDETYDSRSYLMLESYFIKKGEDFDYLKESISGKIFDWSSDIHFSNEHLSSVYFGELYWADNILDSEEYHISIPTGKKITRSKVVNPMDVIIGDSSYKREDIGKTIQIMEKESLYFDGEPTLLHYSWETTSNVLEGHSEYYPATRIAKALDLKADPLSGNILDTNLNGCFYYIDFDENLFQNNFHYMRSDLISEYMKINNLAIIYQIKQNSYSKDNNQNHLMKFFVIE